jgi:uncharacterized protein YndB with AHSA1/START domain
MPAYAHTLQVDAPPADVFAILDDTDRTPEWLSRCTGIDRLDEGPTREGLPLRYHYKEGGRTGEMAGIVTAHEPGRHLAMRYTDKMMDVTVDFVTAPGTTDGSTSLTHTVDVRPQGFGRLLTPLISRALPKQTLDAMTKLKGLAER